MDILQKLSDLGFTNAAMLNEASGLTRIRTLKGWVYERFTSENQIETWDNRNKPEVTE
ncbi:hypothetical protein [Rhizobium leguminosarum]|uniref:hypothetical protein n=1 Tax=Rhizobium leguminosarum TaxID=384 RepID=UPI001C93D6F5|nr:hypothetical protein [Rhizobium leguminosarum]MBY5821482.1 hypothetical protein [Rhizobium leguminosarum]